jgi:ElaB/YqjD/DUF883 family membrane-anchored ribosome-binding protein
MASVVEQVKQQTSQHSDRLSEDLEQLKSSFGQLRSDVTDLLTRAMGFGRHGAYMARDGASAAVDVARSRLSDLKDRGYEGVQSVEQRIEENPLTSALIAFGVGFVLAKILTRR